MSRAQPYRNRMPTSIIQLLDVATRITLFLVGQNGPLSFVFKDRLNNKYKTFIGDTLKCSCLPARNDHCIHTIYVLLKIFKVSPQNPIMWQAAYVDSQLSDLLAGKHTVQQPRRIVRPVFDPNDDFDLPSRYLFQKRTTIQEVRCERMKLNQDSVCPICQQQMNDEMCLSFCKAKCGNNFHLECIKVWAQHKISSQTSITCPMCRSPFGINFLNQLIKQQKQFKKKQVKKANFKCSSCGVDPIPTNPHKCILCTNFQLCECCYHAKKHIKHPFIKRNSEGRWHGAEQRREDQIKMKKYIDNRRRQTTNQKLVEKIRKVQQDPNKLIDFVASSYPYVSKYISDNLDPNKNLGFSSSDMKCIKCGNKKMLFLRRLNCGHFVDHECMKQFIRLGKFHCQQDGQKFAKGFENLQIKQKQMQEPIDFSEVKREFNPRHMQNQNYNFMGGQQEQAPTLTDVLGGLRTNYNNFNYQYQRRNQGQIRSRFTSNLIPREQQTTAQNQNMNMNSNRTRDTSRPPLPHNNQIRIRNVSKSTSKRERQRSQQIPSRSRSKRASRQEMERMLQAMIGRKVF